MQARSTTLAPHLDRASNPFSRFLGLMGRSRLEEGGGLLIEPCSSIHTFFMRFPIDVVFIDRDSRVVRMAENVKPWRIMLGGKGAHAVVELAGGVLAGTAITVGDQLDVTA